MKTIRLVPVLVAFAILAVSVAVSANPQQNQPPPALARVPGMAYADVFCFEKAY